MVGVEINSTEEALEKISVPNSQTEKGNDISKINILKSVIEGRSQTNGQEGDYQPHTYANEPELTHQANISNFSCNVSGTECDGHMTEQETEMTISCLAELMKANNQPRPSTTGSIDDLELVIYDHGKDTRPPRRGPAVDEVDAPSQVETPPLTAGPPTHPPHPPSTESNHTA